MIEKLYNTGSNTAVVACSSCNRQRVVDISKYLDVPKEVKLKVRCKCGNTWSVVLEKRRFFRHNIRLPGTFTYKSAGRGSLTGDMLVVGWGSTMGAIEEAVDIMRDEGKSVSSVHLRFLSPLEPGLKEIFARFNKVITVEINYSDKVGDPQITEDNRRYAQLANILRAQTLVDVDCWSVVYGHPLQPGIIYEALTERLETIKNS